MIIVTGGAGFIGSHLVKALNRLGREDILIVDDLENGSKIKNLSKVECLDFWDKDDFMAAIQNGTFNWASVEVIFHQGACSSTVEQNGRYMMANNYHYSKALLAKAEEIGIPFIYASSASVYGLGSDFIEERRYENPLNVYAYSKFLFDQHVRRKLPNNKSQIVGLRYFNVFGANEFHKGRMASVVHHFSDEIKAHGIVKLFEGSGGYGNGEQLRDFVYVEDIVKINLWFWKHADKSGIFNAGTGAASSFNEVAKNVIAWHGTGRVEYIPFPDDLVGRYQHFTEANLTALRASGYQEAFTPLQDAVSQTLDAMHETSL